MADIKIAEKRRFPRLKDGVKVIYKLMGVVGEKKDDVADVGQGGIRLFLKDKTAPGTLLELGMSLPEDAGPFFALGKVVWQAGKRILGPNKQFCYETGVEFLKMDIQHKMLLIEYLYQRLKQEKPL